jgi:ParB family chromosome partitioning protein
MNKKAGVMFEPEEVIGLLMEVLKEPSGKKVNLSTRHQFVPGATALYKGDKVIFNLDKSRLPAECIEKIESILRDLQQIQPV